MTTPHRRRRTRTITGRGNWTTAFAYADAISGLTIPAQFFIPADADVNVPKRLLVYIAGSGEKGNDNLVTLTASQQLGLIVSGNKATFPHYVLIPQYPAGGTGSEAAAIRRAIFALINAVKAAYNIDAKKVTYTGYSTGGILGYDVLYDDWKYHGGTVFCSAFLCAPSLFAFHMGDPTKGPVTEFLGTYPDSASLSSAAADTVFWDFMDDVIGTKPLVVSLGTLDTTVRYNVDGSGTYVSGTNSSKAVFARWIARGVTAVVDTVGGTGGTFATTDKRVLSGWTGYSHSLGSSQLNAFFGRFTGSQEWDWINAQALP